MESDWSPVSIEQIQADRKGAIAIGPFGSRMKSDCYVEKGVPVIRGTNISGGPAFENDFVYITEEKADSLGSCNVYEDDLVFPHRGSIGEVGIVPSGERYVISSSLMKLTCDPSRVWPRYLFYFFKSHLGRHELLRNASTVGTPGIGQPLTSLKSIRFSLPPKSLQKSIAHILGTLDDKIELNRRMNETLESMARALFKSWFVDFDPVIDNALAAGNPIPEPLSARAQTRRDLGTHRKPLPKNIQKLFPDAFVYHDEIGWMPDDWKAGLFGEVGEHVRDNVPADELNEHEFYVGLEHIGRKELFLSDGESTESITSNKSAFLKHDLLFGKLRPYFHKVCIAPHAGVCSTDILVFRPRTQALASFMFLTAYTEKFVGYANMRSTGTRMPRASAKDMLKYEIVIPSQPILEAFEAQLSPIWEKGMKAVLASGSLAKLRDTLLPKLLSGELRIPDAEKLVANSL